MIEGKEVEDINEEN